MSKSLVFVVEKPYVVKRIAASLSAMWPDAQLRFITTNYLGLHQFRYPHGLGYRDLPYVAEPEWKPRLHEGPRVWTMDGSEAARVGDAPDEVLRQADEIWFAADPDPSGAVAYHVALAQALGEQSATQVRPAVRLTSFFEDEIRSAFAAAGTTADPWFVEILNAGKARRFFDYNFNVNAVILFGDALRDLTLPDVDFALSKYSLQLLYRLRDKPGQSCALVLADMQTWNGTGRYGAAELGSAASRAKIIDDLHNAGLITSMEAREGIELTAAGKTLLQRLHPDCRDMDLPARMDQWEADWPQSRTAVERYLRTFFGKQMRYAQAADAAPENDIDEPTSPRP